MRSNVLKKKVLQLSAEERTRIDRAWLVESRDRLNAYRTGNIKSLDGEAVLKDVEIELK